MKVGNKQIALILIAVTVAAAGYLEVRDRKKPAEPSLSQFADAIVRRDAGLPMKGLLDPLQASLAVRDYVYRSYRLETPTLKNISYDLYYASLTSPDGAMYCGGASAAYAWALSAIGIPSRVVQLAGDDFVSGIDSWDTHVTVEAFIDGAWQISDPTYNLSISCSADPGKPIATPEARACVQRGDSLVLSPGRTRITEKTGLGFKIITPYKYGRYFYAYTRQSTSSTTVSEPVDTWPSPDWLETAASLNADCGVQLGLNIRCEGTKSTAREGGY